MKYLKLAMRSQFDASSRDKRELRVADELGYEVVVCSNDEGVPAEALERGYTFIPACFSPYSGAKSNYFKRFYKILKDARHYRDLAIELTPTVISCHNLYPLLVGCMAAQKISPRPFIIYDAHEFELGLARYQESAVLWRIGRFLEGCLLRKTDLTIVINEGVGDAMVKVHALDFPKVVVRSTPLMFPEDGRAVEQVRAKMLDNFHFHGSKPDEDGDFLAMYQGYIQANRGIENLLEAAFILPWLKVVILGDPNPYAPEYMTHVQDMVHKYSLESRVLFLPSVPQAELWKYTGAADVGIVGHQPVVKNYIYALPNKFFENVQALTPIICTDVPEMARLIKRYDIGMLVAPGDNGGEWAKAISEMRDNQRRYMVFKQNLRRAKEELCWERESLILKKALLNLACSQNGFKTLQRGMEYETAVGEDGDYALWV